MFQSIPLCKKLPTAVQAVIYTAAGHGHEQPPQESLPTAFCKQTGARRGCICIPTCSPKQCCKSDKKGEVKEPAQVSLKQSYPPRDIVPSYPIKPDFAHVLPLVSTQLLHPGLPVPARVGLAFRYPCVSPATWSTWPAALRKSSSL